MNPITRAAKAAFYFFAGDAVILIGVVVAFAVGWVLAHPLAAPNVLTAIVFVAIIVGALTLTLGREVRGRPRAR